MYSIDYNNKKISREIDNKTYVRDLKSPRDCMKYRVFACRLLLSYKENKGFSVYHFLPVDLHNYIIDIKTMNDDEKMTDIKIYKEYFVSIIKKLVKYYPEFENLMNNIDRSSTIKTYRTFDSIFRCYTGSDPIMLGMALSLEMRICTINKNKIDINMVKSLIDNEQFKVITINKELGHFCKEKLKKDDDNIIYLKSIIFVMEQRICNLENIIYSNINQNIVNQNISNQSVINQSVGISCEENKNTIYQSPI